jgi:hypothetical protein
MYSAVGMNSAIMVTFRLPHKTSLLFNPPHSLIAVLLAINHVSGIFFMQTNKTNE